MHKPDSLIFDMDGTLWDAVDTYAISWNIIFEKQNIKRTITRQDLLHVIGMEGGKLTSILMPDLDHETAQQIYLDVNEARREILPAAGGMLYEGVAEGIKQLAGKYQLFVLSNCAVGIIPIFINWAGLSEDITDNMAYGDTGMSKNYNMRLLIDKYDLKNPVYVGDTNGDAEQTRLVGIPFAFVSYGFGQTDDYDIKFDDFASLTQYYMNL